MKRGAGRSAMACTMPSQAQALKSPVAAATGSRSSGGLTERMAPPALRATNVSPTQPTVRSGGM